MQRLVRGLSSSRKAARQGYYVALTEVPCLTSFLFLFLFHSCLSCSVPVPFLQLLSLFPEVSLSQVFQLMHTHLETTGSAVETTGGAKTQVNAVNSNNC